MGFNFFILGAGIIGFVGVALYAIIEDYLTSKKK